MRIYTDTDAGIDPSLCQSIKIFGKDPMKPTVGLSTLSFIFVKFDDTDDPQLFVCISSILKRQFFRPPKSLPGQKMNMPLNQLILCGY